MGTKDGKGNFIWADGSIYNGEFKNNNIDGFVRLHLSTYIIIGSL